MWGRCEMWARNVDVQRRELGNRCGVERDSKQFAQIKEKNKLPGQLSCEAGSVLRPPPRICAIKVPMKENVTTVLHNTVYDLD